MSKNASVRKRGAKQGIMLMLFAILLAPLLALVGLTIDGGRIYFEKRRMQAAADGGAFGAAREILRGNDAFVVSAGRDDSKLNGFDDDASDITVTVNRPPSTGPNSGNNNAVEVIIDRAIPTTFLKVVMRQSSTVRARAVAGVVDELDPVCILALNDSAAGAITVSGTADINAPDCTIAARSNSPSAITTNGGVSLNAGAIGYGNYNGGFTQNGNGTINPPPTFIPPPDDPLCPGGVGSVTCMQSNVPTLSNCSGLNPCQTKQLKVTSGNTANLAPGYFLGGITMNGGQLNLAPGTYFVSGFKATGGTVIGNGVTIVNLGLNKNDNIEITGATYADLHAPYSGTWENILFYNSRTIAPSNGSNTDGTIIGTSDSVFDGILYFPTVTLHYGGNAEQDSPFAMLIADQLRFTGNPSLGVNWEDSGRNPPVRQVSLLE